VKLPYLTKEEFANLVWNTLPSILVIIDNPNDGIISEVSEPAAGMFGYNREELIGLPIETLVPDILRTKHVEHRTKYEKEPVHCAMGNHDMDVRGQRKDGTTFRASIQLTPIIVKESRCVLALVTRQPIDYMESKETK
jgi:PAS domain S-box-containing protein